MAAAIQLSCVAAAAHGGAHPDFLIV